MKFKVASPSDRTYFENKVKCFLGLMHDTIKIYGAGGGGWNSRAMGKSL
jgi:hypothetical protein